MAVMIKTVNLTKRYGTLVALSNLNLETVTAVRHWTGVALGTGPSA